MKDYVVVINKTVLTNIADLDNNLRNYNHEEADTGIVLHALDVSKRDPFSVICFLFRHRCFADLATLL